MQKCSFIQTEAEFIGWRCQLEVTKIRAGCKLIVDLINFDFLSSSGDFATVLACFRILLLFE